MTKEILATQNKHAYPGKHTKEHKIPMTRAP